MLKCSSTCSCRSIKSIAAAMDAAARERPGGNMAGGVEDVINVLSSLAGVLIEGQHSSEAQREAV
jgi:hypothetical protein